MASGHTTSKSLVSIAGAAVAVGLAVLFGKLDGPACRLMSHLVGAAAKTALEVLFSLVPAAWQAFQGYAPNHHWLAPCPLQMATTLWSLLHLMAGTA